MSARLIKTHEGTAIAYAPFTLPDAGDPNVRVQSFASRSALENNSLASAQSSQINKRTSAAAHADAAIQLSASSEEANVLPQNAQAQQIIDEAQSRAAEIERAASARGMAQGLAEGRAQAETEIRRAVEPLRAQFAETLASMDELRRVVAQRAESDMVRLALEIAKKIVHREVTIDNEVALTLARVALKRLHKTATATVHLHPDDYAYVLQHQEQLGTGGASAIELVEDRTIGHGGCLVHTEMGDIDARIEAQFTEIERSFLQL